mgnify:CR=1 FL=1
MADRNPDEELTRLIASARRLGVELDEADALQWMAAMAADAGAKGQAGDLAAGPITVDARSGVFGHRVAMLDFSDQELARFRAIGHLVGFADQPGLVETALALSGSSAQSKIQTYPGDSDYFERVNIKASTRPEACQVLARIMRQKALDTLHGLTYRLIEIKFGNYPADLKRGGALKRQGSPIAWKPAEVQAGYVEVTDLEDHPSRLAWDAVASDPGWCKLDWVVADPLRGQLSNASNMLDVTWEAPDGSIAPLDGYLDPYFQEVYLEAESIPIFSKLAQHVSADALDEYVEQLEGEVNKYLTKDVNYGKVAKRLYNIFRLTGRYEEAAFLRELFDEPTTMLYQVWSLIRTIDDVSQPGTQMTTGQLLAQADQLIVCVVQTLEGDEEAEIVRLLLRLRSELSEHVLGQAHDSAAEAARSQVINLVNNFFYDKLTGMPQIKAYLDNISQERR